MSRTAYFDSRALRFLRELARHNEREWFHAHKPRYEEHLRQPYLRLIGDLQVPLARISAQTGDVVPLAEVEEYLGRRNPES